MGLPTLSVSRYFLILAIASILAKGFSRDLSLEGIPLKAMLTFATFKCFGGEETG